MSCHEIDAVQMIKRCTHRADTQVDTLEVLSTVDVETLVDNTALLSGLHSTGAERMPSSLNVVSDPIVDSLVVLLGVLDVLVDLVGVVWLRCAVPRACQLCQRY